MTSFVKILNFGLLYACYGLVASLLFASNLELDWGMEWLFNLRGSKPAPDDVVIVAIDKETSNQLDLSLTPASWPRSHHATLVRNLANAGARVIAFDIRFETPREDPLEDQAFAEAIGAAGNVVMLNYLSKEDTAKSTGILNFAGILETKTTPPIELFADAAAAVAPFPLPKDSPRFSQYRLFIPEYADVPTLPTAAFQIFAGDSFQRVLYPLIVAEARRLGVNDPIVNNSERATDRMRSLRRLFTLHPPLTTAVLARLDSIEEHLPDTQLQLMESLVRIYSGPDERFLDFYGPPRSVKHVSYHHILANEFTKSGVASSINFQGKAVFVGFSQQLQEQWDSFHTVFSQPDGTDLSGVEIAATAFANLLARSEIKPLQLSLRNATLILWGLVLSALFVLFSVRLAIICVGTIAALYTWGAYVTFARHGIWMPLVAPILIQCPLALLSDLFWRYKTLHKEREKILRALNHYLPTWVVDELIRTKHYAAEKGRNCFGVCLVTDAEQYTRLSEELDPERLHSLLNQYYKILFKPVTRRGGFISDVVGDSMLAIWPTDTLDQTCRQNACDAAIEIINRVQSFRPSPLNASMPTRIGLHCGEIFLGNVGADEHFEYRAVGDTVNTSQRIEQANKRLGTRILASARVVEGLDGMVTRYLGDYRLRGRTRSIGLSEIAHGDNVNGPARQQLHVQFAEGLELFQIHKWQAAMDIFEEILKTQGDDPPSRYYRDLSAKCLDESPRAWDGVID